MKTSFPGRRVALVLLASQAFFLRNLTAHEEKPVPSESPERVQRFLEDRVQHDPDDIISQNRLAEIYLERLRETGGYEWLRRASEAVRRSLASVPAQRNASGLYMDAKVEYESHHFAAARDRALALTKIEPGKSRGFILLGDALLEFGEIDQAADAYAEMQKRKADPIEIETRLARLEEARGAFDPARMHLEKALAAARQLSPASPEIVAWCLVELGQLAFALGRWDEAEKNYRAALVEHADDFGALEHMAELRAAQKKYEESVVLYEKVIARRQRPEFWHALGQVYGLMGKSAEAADWCGRARDAFLKNAEQGNAHYFHHLAEFFSDTETNPKEALKWARRDLELRHTAEAEDTLAWAHYRDGDSAQAGEIMTRLLARGTRDAHILAHAGTIFMKAGNADRGKELLAEAARINPRHDSFSVHR